MAKFKVSPNLEEYNRKIYELGAKATEHIENAVKKGADPVADEIRARLNAVPVDDSYHKPGQMRAGPRSIQKGALQATLGVSPIRNDNGFINVKVGFDGYNHVRTDAWPSGQPNAMIARSIESGTSFMAANPFIGSAVRATKKAASDAMQKEIENLVNGWFG